MKKSNTALQAQSLKLGQSGTDVHIWQITLDSQIKEIWQLSSYLSPSEHTRISRFHSLRDRERYTVTRAMLRLILSKYLQIPPAEITFCTTSYGKPELAKKYGVETKQLQFNLSHSGNMAIYVIARGQRVGVDIERIRPEVEFEPLVTRFFTPSEQAILQRYPKSKRKEVFFRLWVLKEAYLKARGEGLSIPLESFSVRIDQEQANATLEVADDPDESTRWRLRELNLQAEYAAALAVAGHRWNLEMFEWDGLREVVSW